MLEPLLLSLELVAITVLIPSEFVIGGAYFPPLLIAGLFGYAHRSPPAKPQWPQLAADVVRAKQQESTGKICIVDVRAARITSEQLACAETEIGDLAAGKESR